RGIAKNPDFISKVAHAIFRDRNGKPALRSVRAVAKELGCRPQPVAAALQRCVEEGVMYPLLRIPQQQIDKDRLESAVKARYKLERVLLVPGNPDMLKVVDKERRRSLHTEVIRGMAHLLAGYLDEIIDAAALRQREAHEAGRAMQPFRLGTAWGRTMHMLAELLLETRRESRRAELHVLPIIGITSTLNTLPVEANVV